MKPTTMRRAGKGFLFLCIMSWLPIEILIFIRDREIAEAHTRFLAVADQFGAEIESAWHREIESGKPFNPDTSQVATIMREKVRIR